MNQLFHDKSTEIKVRSKFDRQNKDNSRNRRYVKAGFHYRRSRSVNWSRKSAYDLVKIENRSRKWSHKLDSESERFHFFRFRLPLHRLRTYLRSRENYILSEAEAKEPTNHKARNRALCLVYSFASASDFHEIVSDGVTSRIGVLLPIP